MTHLRSWRSHVYAFPTTAMCKPHRDHDQPREVTTREVEDVDCETCLAEAFRCARTAIRELEAARSSDTQRIADSWRRRRLEPVICRLVTLGEGVPA